MNTSLPSTTNCIRTLLLAAALTLVSATPLAWAGKSATPTAGTLDVNFDPYVSGGGGRVNAVAAQLDGKMIIGGDFNYVGDASHLNLARLNVDGSVDASFSLNTDRHVNCLAVQDDGRILVAGQFSRINGVSTANGIARLNADGSVENSATFNALLGPDQETNCLAVQADGKIVLGGAFSEVNREPRKGVVRLNPNGSLESTATFNPGLAAGSYVSSLAVQAAG